MEETILKEFTGIRDKYGLRIYVGDTIKWGRQIGTVRKVKYGDIEAYCVDDDIIIKGYSSYLEKVNK